MDDLAVEFAKYQVDGYLGDPIGEDAYAYLRWSTVLQGEDGGTLPRQLERIHIAAKRDKLRITFGRIFVDAGKTGFDIENRTALQKLLAEVDAGSRANHLVIEDIDRLSRQAVWHQGYLLDERLGKKGIQVHFYNSPGGMIERTVLGVVAQNGMEVVRARMTAGIKHKAKSGRITARYAKYGYRLTDRKDTHYEIVPEEARLVREMYNRVVYKRQSLRSIARWLNDQGYRTRAGKTFNIGNLQRTITSPVYKGDFYANQLHFVWEVAKRGRFKGKRIHKKVPRPPEEWIHIKVPAIVTEDEWNQAQERMKRNSKLAMRNGKTNGWLLQSLLKCALCHKYTLIAHVKHYKTKDYRVYHCGSQYKEDCRVRGTVCKFPQVRADKLEPAVWNVIQSVIYKPDLILSRMDEQEADKRQQELQRQIAYIQKEIRELEAEEGRLEAAYHRGIWDLDKFEAKMKDVASRKGPKENEIAKLEAQLAESVSIAEQKQVVLDALTIIRKEVERARRENRMPDDIPFDLKRKILTLVVQTIWVDSVNKTFTLEGEVSGTFSFADSDSEEKGGIETDFAFPPGSKGSLARKRR